MVYNFPFLNTALISDVRIRFDVPFKYPSPMVLPILKLMTDFPVCLNIGNYLGTIIVLIINVSFAFNYL